MVIFLYICTIIFLFSRMTTFYLCNAFATQWRRVLLRWWYVRRLGFIQLTIYVLFNHFRLNVLLSCSSSTLPTYVVLVDRETIYWLTDQWACNIINICFYFIYYHTTHIDNKVEFFSRLSFFIYIYLFKQK